MWWATTLAALAAAGAALARPAPAQLAAQLTLDEQLTLVHGALGGCGYTGLTNALPKHGVPELRMNDGPQGFRGEPGTSTAYPCALSFAASFSPALAKRWGEHMGLEWKLHGANVMLGPGLNVLRTANNGRAFEYLSGEDPVLGAVLGVAVTRGVQSQGIIATAKHWALNNQESQRFTVSAQVGDVVANELYFRPFEAVVRRGKAAAVMCAYNRINGTHACENARILRRKLRDEWGFRGFVVSDWGATHHAAPASAAGLDLEMPLGLFFGAVLRQQALHDAKVRRRVAEQAAHVLHAMDQVGILASKQPAACLRAADSGSSERDAFAKEAAVQGAVLLKNAHEGLPLRAGANVVLVGPAANATDVVVGGGSGRVDAGQRVVTALEGLQAASARGGTTAGTVSYSATPPATLAGADAAVVVVAVSSAEGEDRAHLGFAPEDDALIEAMAEASRQAHVPLIVVGVVPGPVLLPWASQAQAILLMFMPGQAFGSALGDLLFGAEAPAGRLPVTIPRQPRAWAARQYPGQEGDDGVVRVLYSEGLLTGYRAPDADPLFPFGHGLAYTTFAYDSLKVRRVPLVRKWLVSVGVRNTGTRAGDEVVQLYLRRHNCTSDRGGGGGGRDAVRRPALQLVGFTKVVLLPNAVKVARLVVDMLGVGEWDTARQRWALPGHACRAYELVAGSSSAALRVSAPIDFGGTAAQQQ